MDIGPAGKLVEVRADAGELPDALFLQRRLPQPVVQGTLADEIRQFLIESVSRTGGHLASNLGAVELTLALHNVLDFPEDKLIWDVGHQAYTHKILTGRKDAFATLRKEGEIEEGSRKPMEGRTGIRLSILEDTCWENQRIEIEISVSAKSLKCCLSEQ